MTVMYSLIIPLKNEEENVLPLIAEIEPIMNLLKKPWELICIDDGSTDSTLELLKNLKTSKSFLRILKFSRNFGQTSAFDAGFRAARGRFTVTLDGDCQNDPNDIPKLLLAIQDCDLVVGWRHQRRDPWIKRITSSLANMVRSRVCEDHLNDINCSLKVFRTDKLKQIKLYQGMHRFLPALFQIEGFSTKEIPVNHRPRPRGKSKYGFSNRFIGPIIDMFAVSWMRKRKLHYKIEEEV